jgi:pimeloyl-ACP methyl ester carboxylesterase
MHDMRVLPIAVLVLTAAACDGGSNDSSSGGAGAAAGGGAAGTGGSAGASACAAGTSIVSFETDDGVQLEADFAVTGTTGGPGAVLLHMIPPSNDRTNYPPAFISALLDKGISVLNVDRRGAGNSGGVALDAYQGDKGKLDVKAAVLFLTAGACAIDPARIAIIGASNGTTSALDFALYAAADPTAPLPKALVFLTGGSYTENQNSVDANRGILEPLAIDFVYSAQESAWSTQFSSGAPTPWKFSEYDPGAHGTGMFSSRPESIGDVAGFVAGAL